MTDFHVQRVTDPDFTAEARLDGKYICASLTGNADLRSKENLDVFLTALHGEAARIGVAEVSIDFTELRFMNSSCFKNFISWITSTEEMSADRRYKIRFISNPSMHWQKRSLHALSCFASEIVSIHLPGAAE